MAVEWLARIIFGVLWAQRLAVLRTVILSSFPLVILWENILKYAILMHSFTLFLFFLSQLFNVA
jgi:hypothetical protein